MSRGDNMKIEIRNRCSDYTSYRAARVKSLFNAESGCNFNLDATLDIDDDGWQLGLIVGPSGSGKTSMGRQILDGSFYEPKWPANKPIVEAIAPKGKFNDVTAALAAVGLGDVPSWLRPYSVLSNGEKFRADLARVISERPSCVVIDEFTSVVDRQIAKFGALAFGKAWKRTGGKAVLLSCHYDIVEWLEPDWVFDTSSGEFTRRRLRRPSFDLEIVATDWRYWHDFEPHHYLKLPKMIGAKCYVGVVEKTRVCHLAVATANRGGKAEARACRLVVLPEWQGAGVGLRFLNAVCQIQATGEPGARLPGRSVTTVFHTSHPGLCAALRRMPQWRQLSAKLHGDNKKRGARSVAKSAMKKGVGKERAIVAGYGGHFRAVQGFRYYGAAGAKKA